jgi:hypothetical protein
MFECASVKFIQKNIVFIMSLCPPSVLNEQIGSQCKGVSLHVLIENFSKFIEKTQVSLKSDKNNGTFYFWCFLEHQCRKFNLNYKFTKQHNFHEDLCTLVTMCRRMFSKCFREGFRENHNIF